MESFFKTKSFFFGLIGLSKLPSFLAKYRRISFLSYLKILWKNGWSKNFMNYRKKLVFAIERGEKCKNLPEAIYENDCKASNQPSVVYVIIMRPFNNIPYTNKSATQRLCVMSIFWKMIQSPIEFQNFLCNENYDGKYWKVAKKCNEHIWLYWAFRLKLGWAQTFRWKLPSLNAIRPNRWSRENSIYLKYYGIFIRRGNYQVTMRVCLSGKIGIDGFFVVLYIKPIFEFLGPELKLN